MQKLSKLYFNVEFIIARFSLYGIVTAFYFYLVFINTVSCPDEYPCPLCNMKTAVWELIHFNIEKAFQLNDLVVVILILIIYIALDAILVGCYTIKSYRYKTRR